MTDISRTEVCKRHRLIDIIAVLFGHKLKGTAIFLCHERYGGAWYADCLSRKTARAAL